jgi:hypothetical protein
MKSRKANHFIENLLDTGYLSEKILVIGLDLFSNCVGAQFCQIRPMYLLPINLNS